MDQDITLEFHQPAEQLTLIEAACREYEALNPPLGFKHWGVIHGVQNDYYIIQSYIYHPFNRPMTYYSRDGATWTRLPEVQASVLTKKPVFIGMFYGDPTMPVNFSDYSYTGDTLAQTPNQIREEDRLAYFVSEVDSEGMMLPLSSYELTKTGYICPNPSYNGMSFDECVNLRNYWTVVKLGQTKLGGGDFRKQESLIPLLQAVPDHGTVRGRWKIAQQAWGNHIVMQNIRFPGLQLIIAIDSPSFQRIYDGDGIKEINEPFVHGSSLEGELLIDVGFMPDYDYKILPEIRPLKEDPDGELLTNINEHGDKMYTSELASSIISSEEEGDTSQDETENVTTDAENSPVTPPPTSENVTDVSAGETSANESET